jgi:hypothetical protein
VRIPFPERVPLDRVAIFAIALFIIQRVEGTPLYFSAGCVVFLLLAAVAFNVGGGLTRASGAYVFFYSFLVVIVGLCYKAYLGEAADSNLLDPHTTIKVLDGGMAAMLAAVFVSRRFSRKSGLLQNMLKDSEMYRASVGCIVFGVLGAFAIALLGESGAKLGSAFTQLNQLIPLGIIIGVIYEIRRSGGTRSVNLPILFGIGYFFLLGILSFSKEGMLTPFVCWLVPVWAFRYRLSAMQVVGCLLGAFIVFHYLVPYSQYGRRFRPEEGVRQSFGQSFAISERLLEHPEETRRLYEEEEVDALGGYYNKPQGFWDRLEFISVDDGLINVTDQGHVFGFSPIAGAFVNLIPHILWPNKPAGVDIGNVYAHEIGSIPEENTTTGIAFSPTGEAYHMGEWVGVLVVAPLIWFLLFILYDSLFGDLRATPWGLLVLVAISKFAPEGAITGVIYYIGFGTEIFLFCAFFAKYVAPFFAIAVLGPDRGMSTRKFPFRSTLTPRVPN